MRYRIILSIRGNYIPQYKYCLWPFWLNFDGGWTYEYFYTEERAKRYLQRVCDRNERDKHYKAKAKQYKPVEYDCK